MKSCVTKELPRGVLIAFEGIDGGGKTTQVARTKIHLDEERYAVVSLQEPTKGPWGRKIREVAQLGRGQMTAREELRLFLKDRQEDVERNIRPALTQKKIVLLDRYYYSSMAYQGALGLDPAEIQRANEAFAPKPDLVIILQISPQVSLPRLKEGREGKVDRAYEQETYLMRVQKIYDELEGPHIHRLDARGPQKEVTAQVLEIIQDFLKGIE